MKDNKTTPMIYEVATSNDYCFTFSKVVPRNQKAYGKNQIEIGFYLQRFVNGNPEMFTTVSLEEAEKMAVKLKELIEKIKAELR